MVLQYILLPQCCSLHVQPLAMEAGVANAYIAMTINIATTSYCHAWEWTTMIAINSNSCNAKLAMIAISYCNHWQWMRICCNIYLLQPNWAYCNFFVVVQGSESSSVTSNSPPHKSSSDYLHLVKVAHIVGATLHHLRCPLASKTSWTSCLSSW